MTSPNWLAVSFPPVMLIRYSSRFAHGLLPGFGCPVVFGTDRVTPRHGDRVRVECTASCCSPGHSESRIPVPMVGVLLDLGFLVSCCGS